MYYPPSPNIGYTKTTSEETPVTNQIKDSLQCGFDEDNRCDRPVSINTYSLKWRGIVKDILPSREAAR